LIERVTKGTWDFKNYYCSQPVELNFSPTPKPVGQVRLSGPGAISNLRLRLADATLAFDTPGGQATAFIERARNVVFIRLMYASYVYDLTMDISAWVMQYF
jgi:hypothetical protein